MKTKKNLVNCFPQIIVAFISQAGGAGKTTIAVNVAYELALRGYSVVILDFDFHHSVDIFLGLNTQKDRSLSSSIIFDSQFEGNYPLINWVSDSNIKLSVIQGHDFLKETKESLILRRRREYVLKKIFVEHPLKYDFVFLDCESGFDIITENAISCATDLLIPVDTGAKTLNTPVFLKRIWETINELELDPPPNILGLIPNKANISSSKHSQLLNLLATKAKQMEIPLYPAIRYWQHLDNASTDGIPLKSSRPKDSVNIVFNKIADALENSIKEKTNG